MSRDAGSALSLLTYGVASRPLPGEHVSGDAFVVAPFSHGVLVGVVDGLGHGTAAAQASAAAVEFLETHAADDPASLVQGCHQQLTGTRGAVMTLASFNATTATMTWIGIGNVEGVLISDDQRSTRVVQRAGVIGVRANLPSLRNADLEIAGNETLILATDGISARFTNGLLIQLPPQELADTILDRAAKNNDDALVFVARWTGEP